LLRRHGHQRARDFYEGVLGLKPTTNIEGQWVEYEFGPYALAIGCAPGMFKPNPDGCMAALEVENFDDAIAHLKQHDIKFRMEPMECPPCRMAMVFDPTATVFASTNGRRNNLPCLF